MNLAERRSDLLVRHIDDLRAAMKKVKDVHSFAILAMVVLPEQMNQWRLVLTFQHFDGMLELTFMLCLVENMMVAGQ